MAAKQKLYLAVTSDELSLPLAVCTSASELARLQGVKESTVYRQISKCNEFKHPKYIKIEVDMEDD